MRFGLKPEFRPMPDDNDADVPRILALTYSDSRQGADAVRRLIRELRSRRATCVGFIENDVPPRPGQLRCDMVLECLSEGKRLKISEDRGPLARGCRLDSAALADALAWATAALSARPDVFVVNKFGKSEAEGAGFRPLIAEAIDLGIAVLIAVPWRNIETWRSFAGALAREIDVVDLVEGTEAGVVDQIFERRSVQAFASSPCFMHEVDPASL
jgi:hypothetical protein